MNHFRETAMFNNVLVGVDGRQGGRDAIALAVRLAAPGARITLAHVDPIEVDARGSDPHADSTKMLSEERAGAAIDAQILAVKGASAAGRLHQLAADRRYDLLVVGSCHRGPLARRFAGDHAVRSLHGAPCAVAIAPSGYAPPSHLARIGVGRDGSPESTQALEAARAVAARTGATIEPLLVLPRQSVPYGQPIEHRWSEVAKQLTAEDLARLGGADDLEGQVRYGSPGEKLVGFSEEVDLLIVGSRSSGPVGRLFTGSTSDYLARHARCPLLVFPRSADELPASRPAASQMASA
ncbi:MAG: universal stress protein [Solirubrobacteraceae bacterium]